MGIGFGAMARVPDSGGKVMSRGALFAAIRKAVEDSCEDPYLASLMQFEEHEHELAVSLHPGSEPVFFVWNPDGTIGAAAKTSTTGPGYHAYAIEMVRAVGQTCAIDWDWSDDDTGYATKGDFADLQAQMAAFLSSLAESFLQDAQLNDVPTLAVNMSTGAPVPAHGGPFSITPLGPRSRSFWEALKRGEKVTQHAREFYPWWTRDRDADYYLKTGMTLLWCDVPWHPPEDDHEERTMQLALDCFERAADLKPDIELPDAEIAELKQLLDLDEDEELPSPDPKLAGYYRAVIRRRLPGPWRVELPGYWMQDFKEDTGTLSLWHRNRTAHFSTYDLSPDNPNGPLAKAADIAQPDPENVPKGAKPVRFRRDDRVGFYWIIPTEEDGENAFLLQGCMAVDGSAADITLWFQDPNDRSWAIKTFESVSHTGNSDDPED